ncbi:survival protein sure-like phosphatase/nucleotidase [Aspergillus spinulosporus]
MRPTQGLALALALGTVPLASAINIVSSNDDGWAEINIRQLFSTLTSADSANKPPAYRKRPCQFDSCPAKSGPYGSNATDPRLNWVNSYPVTSIAYGIDTLSPQFFHGPPDLAVSGPNVGSTDGLAVYFSGTVGAATYAATTGGIPAIAFSGADGSPTAWDAEVPAYSTIYAELAAYVVEQLVSGGPPYLPPGVWVNVNFPSVEGCSTADDFGFVLSRMSTALPLITDDDVETCGSTRLPTENDVLGADGCYVSISVGVADSSDADATSQWVVLQRLADLLTCLP